MCKALFRRRSFASPKTSLCRARGRKNRLRRAGDATLGATDGAYMKGIAARNGLALANEQELTDNQCV